MTTIINYSINWLDMDIRCNNFKPKLGINFSRNSKFKSLWGSLRFQHVLWAFLQKILIHLVFYFMGLNPCVSLSTLKWHKNRQYSSLILIFFNMSFSILYGIQKMLHEYKEWNIFQNLCQKKHEWEVACPLWSKKCRRK